MRELFLNGSLAMEFWPALEQPTLQLRTSTGTSSSVTPRSGKTADRHLRRLEPRGLRELAEQGGGLEVHTVHHPRGRERGRRRPDSGECHAAEAFLQENREGPDRILEHLNNAHPRPLSPRYLEVSDIQVTLAQDVYSGMNRARRPRRPAQTIDALNNAEGRGGSRRGDQARAASPARFNSHASRFPLADLGAFWRRRCFS
jgi:multiple sugar transport system substrate-binding protein